MRKRLFAVLVVFISCFLAACSGGVEEGMPEEEAKAMFRYDVVDDNYIRIREYIGKEKEVQVPERIAGKNVTELDTGSFKNCSVKKITVPASVETIRSLAFYNLADCEEVIIGNKMSLKSDDIFTQCPKLKVHTKGKGTIVWFLGNSLIAEGNLDMYFQDVCDQKKEPVVHFTNTGEGYTVADHLSDFQENVPETAYLTADIILVQPLYEYDSELIQMLRENCRKDVKIYSLGTIYTRYRDYCKFQKEWDTPPDGFTPGGDICDDLIQKQILKQTDIQSLDEVHPTYLNGFISGVSIYKELFHGFVKNIDYKKMSYSLDAFITGTDEAAKKEKVKQILDEIENFDREEYQKSGRAFYGYSLEIKRGND